MQFYRPTSGGGTRHKENDLLSKVSHVDNNAIKMDGIFDEKLKNTTVRENLASNTSGWG